MRVWYRVRQFLTGWLGRVDERDLAEVRQWLSPAEFELFQRMPRNDQRHSLAVLGALRCAGYDSPDLMAAALLHDVGKIRAPLRLWQRAVAVLGRKLAPGLAARLAQGSEHSLARPFVTAARHPDWGADLVANAGGSRLTVALIRRHAEPPLDGEHGNVAGNNSMTMENHLLAALQRADDEN